MRRRTKPAKTKVPVRRAAEDQEAVFEEFRQVGTASKKVEGPGLGLALSRKFIELHGGRIWVKSIDQLVSLLRILDCDVDLVVRARSA